MPTVSPVHPPWWLPPAWRPEDEAPGRSWPLQGRRPPAQPAAGWTDTPSCHLMLPRRDGARRRSQLRLERRRRRLRQEMRTLGVGRVEGQEQPQRQEQPQERQEQHQRDEQQWEPPRQEQQRRRALRAAGEGLYEGPVRVLLLSDSVDRYVLQFWWVVGAGGRGLGVLRGGAGGGEDCCSAKTWTDTCCSSGGCLGGGWRVLRGGGGGGRGLLLSGSVDPHVLPSWWVGCAGAPADRPAAAVARLRRCCEHPSIPPPSLPRSPGQVSAVAVTNSARCHCAQQHPFHPTLARSPAAVLPLAARRAPTKAPPPIKTLLSPCPPAGVLPLVVRRALTSCAPTT